jgi:alkylation response protein AidB-like acyl-CoA dehydrogenase
MESYAPPLRDIRFTLEHLVDLAGLSKLPAFTHADPDTVYGLLEEYGRFVAEVIAPLDRLGDTVGSVRDAATGSVSTPPGFADAYRRYVDAGWGSVPFAPEHGGGGFPWLVALAMQELLTSANMAFSLCPLLTQGAIDLLGSHGSEEQRERFLRPMVSGRWTGTMNLTEPQAGSDLGALRTRAVPADDGTWRVSGTKIFITYGEHDMVDNIVHLVLARVPDAPPGTRGISCFVVPKFVVDDQGAPGERNRVRCLSIEHKLGIHASPTCVMEYDDAVGYLVGDVNGGMRAMFTMMNNARLSVGLSGLSVAEVAYQQAVAYALERHQGRAPTAPPGTSSPIVEHADVRRMLLTMRSTIEAMRGLLYLNAEAVDLERHALDEDTRLANRELADLLTPVSKAWCTDMGMDVARLATQVYGGMGYVEETGIAQRERDIRIAAIYEGTNGIQAMDLVGRKLPMRGGGVVDDFLRRMEETAAPAEFLAPLREAIGALREATAWILAHGADRPDDAYAAAGPYLRMFGITAGGWVMARQAVAAAALGDDDPYAAAKVATARFYCTELLPQAAGLLPAVRAGADLVLGLPAAELVSR